MFDLWNFKDTIVVANHFWIWMLIALVIGILAGWIRPFEKTNNED